MARESWNRLVNLRSGILSEWLGESAHGRLPRWVGFAVQVFREFWRNRCQVRASALAYTTLLAIVPLLAVVISVASLVIDVNKPDHQQKLRAGVEQLVASVAPTLGLSDTAGNEKRDQVVTNLLLFVGNIRFGAIGVSAMGGLFFVAISLLRTIEAAFNDIWGVSVGRGWFQSIVLYWAALTLGPLVFLVVKSADYLKTFGGAAKWLQAGSPGYGLWLLSSGLPAILLGLGFVGLYRLMPNTRVRWSAAVVGAVVATGLWWLNNRAAHFYNSRVVTYSAVYGSLGLLPLFLIGLYLSWLILLLGAQTAYVFQNRETYLQDQQADRLDQAGRELLALRCLLEIGDRFAQGQPGPNLENLSAKLGVPARLANRLLGSLLSAGLVSEALPRSTGSSKATVDATLYVPAKPLTSVTLTQIWRAVRENPGVKAPAVADGLSDRANHELKRLIGAAEALGDEVSWDALVRRRDCGSGASAASGLQTPPAAVARSTVAQQS